MARTQAGLRSPAPAGRVFSEPLHRIRAAHIEVEAILQSLAALQDDTPCAGCTRVCCREVMCRESVDSDFLRFVLGARIGAYHAENGWLEPGAGCRLCHGRPLVCYEFFCEAFESPGWMQLRQLSRALKTLYANAFAGQHMLVVDDIGRITAHRLNVIQERLEALRDAADAALRQALSEKPNAEPAGLASANVRRGQAVAPDRPPFGGRQQHD